MRSLADNKIPEITITVLAAILRFWRLDYHSIWFDEAVSLRWAGAPPFHVTLNYMIAATFQLAEDKHPPAYYTLLHIWREAIAPFGLEQSDAALRASGALLGVLTVVGIMLLASRLSGRFTGLLTGTLVAVCPVLIWYSQELRMFQPATTFIVWAGFALAGAWHSDRRTARLIWWLGFIALVELALYSYLFSAFALIPIAAMHLLLFFWIGRPRPTAMSAQESSVHINNGPDDIQAHQDGSMVQSSRQMGKLLEGAVALGIVVLLFLPLVLNAWQVNADESTPGKAFADVVANTQRQLKIFTIWREDWPSPLDDLALGMLALLAILGLIWPLAVRFRSGRREQQLSAAAVYRAARGSLRPWQTSVLLCCWLGLPYVAANVLLATNGAMFKEERYHLYLAPFLLWTIAFGAAELGRLRRWLGWAGGGLALLLLSLALPLLWSPAFLREDWRAAANYIDEYQQLSPSLSSAGVAHINYTHQAIDWYLQQHYTFEELPVFGLFGDPLTPEQIDTVVAPPLKGIVKYGAKTLWLSQSHLEGIDDDRLVEGWLRANFPVITEQYPTGVKLTGFALQTLFDEVPPLAKQAMTREVELTSDRTVVACEILSPELRSTDQRLHPPSSWVHIRIWWRPTARPRFNYETSARVIDSRGVWGERLHHADGLSAHMPASSWEPNKIVREEVDINLNPVITPGNYTVVVGLTDEGGKGIGREASCGTVQIID